MDIRVVKRSITIPLTVNVLPGTKYMIQNDDCTLAWSLLFYYVVALLILLLVLIIK